MPIYAYRCATCGHAKDVLQKVSDPVLSTCPACGAQTFSKQVTAAGFQLKGSGWYVTDFRGDNTARKADKGDADGAAADKGEQPAQADGTAAAKPSESPAAPAAAPAPATTTSSTAATNAAAKPSTTPPAKA